ncbi:helix-turn-helix domain-containing protein [Desulfolutivibrio sulfoxidireducens]|uniref:helix-turn-helix domain-containing protein n=1 Tax=Desulfolutivibrio sulfoxidireducens TaxID=2773299 RepID=UPI00159DF8DE|nr:helix-turn-helix transcriptional regulator [Desulfolutivibrio sulfoxidireducens]QLA17566.1 helix-turn-helix domain-containing protein [Desulfolutivibrio sulfoxidireducens]
MDSIKNFTLGDVTYFGPLAETAATISIEDMDYYKLIDNVSDQIADYMEKKKITKSELAHRMGTSRAFVTKILSGDVNMTFKTLSRILHHLGAKPEIKICSKDAAIRWLGVVVAKSTHKLVAKNLSSQRWATQNVQRRINEKIHVEQELAV